MKHSLLLLLTLLLCVTLAPAAMATDFHVDDDAPGDPGPGDTSVSDPLEDGSAAHPFDAIQEAIDAAAYTGDTVLVADGTYTGDGNRDMDFFWRRITVRSVNGPGACTIDAQGTPTDRHRVFTFQHGEGRNAVVQGFTITGGHAYEEDGGRIGGGAILISDGSPTLNGNLFIGNSSIASSGDRYYGGAIYCGTDTTPLISGNVFIGNEARLGGAVNCTESSAEITGNTFQDNQASDRGCAIHCISETPWTYNPVITHNTFSGHTGVGTGASAVWLSWVDGVVSWNEFTDNDVLCLRLRVGDPIVEHNTFSGNTDGCIWTGPNGAPYIHQNSFTSNSGGDGVGVTVDDYQDAAIIDNYFFDNHSDGDGGAIEIYTYADCQPLVLGNVIVGNTAVEDGGGICSANDARPIIAGNIITGNQAGDRGGAIYTATNQWQILNNLITENSAGEGGGIHVYNNPYHLGAGTMSGNTVALNTAVDGGGIYLLVEELNETSITDSIVWGNTPNQVTVLGIAPTISHCCVQGGAIGPGNFDADPLFVNGPDGDYYFSSFFTGHGATSPCVNRASDAASATLVPVGYDPDTAALIEAPLSQLTCRIDHAGDTGQADIGFHASRTSLVSSDLVCLPESGTVPFAMNFSATINNHRPQTRQLAGRIDARLGGGRFFSNWRVGYTVIAGGGSYVESWVVNTPAYPSVLGNNVFTLCIEDVTPAPYNQPPWPESGDTGTDQCEVTAIAP